MADPLGIGRDFNPAEKKNPGQYEVQKWLRQIKAAEAKEKDYRASAEKVVKLYEQEGQEKTPFNMLYSNTETLQPALFNELPRPVVSRRYKDEDPLGLMASRALQRTLEYTIDTPDAAYQPFFGLMENAVLNALVPGRGVTQFFYDADIENAPKPEPKGGDPEESMLESGEESEIAEEPAPEGQAPEGAAPEPIPQVKYECICGEAVDWDGILYGYAKRWTDVPWIAFRRDMTKGDAVESFGPDIANKLSFTDKKSDESKENDEKKRDENTCRIWEIWAKKTRTIIFICETFPDQVIKRVKDPLGLSGFFNIPEPLVLTGRPKSLIPIPLYTYYQRQAQEVSRLTVRIDKITEAIKVRGFYDGTVGDLKALFNSGDNTLLPMRGTTGTPNQMAMDKALWMMPLNDLVSVLQILVQQRQNVKQVIYEITGISDILRGSSVASETATAQNIKNQWGTLRLKRMQKRVQRYVRDCLRIIAELQSKHYSEETFAKQTGLPFQTSEEKQQAVAALQQMQGQMQQMAAPQPNAGMAAPQGPGGPPSPPPGPPQGPAGMAPPGQPGEGPTTPPPAQPDPMQQQMQAQMQELAQKVQQPSWGDILQLLHDDLLRNYKVDIETNSTVDPEAVEDKKELGELMQALASTLQTLLPQVQTGVMPMSVVKAILMSITRRYRFGPEVEDALNQMSTDVQVTDPKQLDKMQKDLQAQQQKLQEQEQQMQQQDLQVKQKQSEIQFKEQNLAAREQMFAEQQKIADQQRQLKEEQMMLKIELRELQATRAIQQASAAVQPVAAGV